MLKPALAAKPTPVFSETNLNHRNWLRSNCPNEMKRRKITKKQLQEYQFYTILVSVYAVEHIDRWLYKVSVASSSITMTRFSSKCCAFYAVENFENFETHEISNFARNAVD
jgi:hypothetical protein